MKQENTIVWGITVIALLASVSMAAAKPAGKGAFLTSAADTVADLVRQVQTDTIVAMRYARHFGMDSASIANYFRNELSVATLDSNITVPMYYLDDKARIAVRTTRLSAGIKVFINKAGSPILICGSGNPLTSSLSYAEALKSEELASSTIQAEGATNTSECESPVVAVYMPEISTSDTSEGSPSMSSFSSWIIPIGLAGAIAMMTGGGSGGGSSIGDNRGPTPDIVAVPEPAGIAALAAAITACIGSTLRRRRLP